jgi:hypothetical protein
MLFTEQTKLVFIYDTIFDVDPERACIGGTGWLVIRPDWDFDLAPRWVTWTDAAIVWDRKIDVTGIIVVWWGRHTVLPPHEVKRIRLRCGSEEQTRKTKVENF